MKNYTKKILILIAGLFLLTSTAQAVTIFTVPQGGTGVGTISGIIAGHGTSPFSAAVSGTDIKTINSTSLLGSGNITVGGTPASPSTSVQFNNSGSFGGDSNLEWDNTNKQLIIGSSTGFVNTPNTGLQIGGNQNTYFQSYIQNSSNQPVASSDYIAGADNDGVSLIGHYHDIGINGSGWSASDPANALFTAGLPDDGYDYVSGGNLILGTDAQVLGKGIKGFAGGLTTGDQVFQSTKTVPWQILRPINGQGTVSNSAGGTVVTGVNTAFTKTFQVGDYITIPASTGQRVLISVINSDTQMHVAAITSANSAVSYSTDGGTKFLVNSNGLIGMGTANPLAALDIEINNPTAQGNRALFMNSDSSTSSSILQGALNTWSSGGVLMAGQGTSTSNFYQFLALNHGGNGQNFMTTGSTDGSTLSPVTNGDVLYWIFLQGDDGSTVGGVNGGNFQAFVDGTVSTGKVPMMWQFDTYDQSGNNWFPLTMRANGDTFIGRTSNSLPNPTAQLEINAGTATAGTAPLKIDGGTLLSTPEAYSIEPSSTHLYWTDGGGSRHQLDQQAGTTYSAGTGLTLSGTAFSLTAPVTVALGGTNCTSALITCLNNITGFSAAGTTGTTSTNLVFSGAPTLTNPVVGTQATTDNSTKAASTAYVTTAINNAIAGVNPAVAVQAATTSSSDTSGFTYNNGVSGIGATFTGTTNTAVTIDGYTFTALGQRLLVKNDTQSPSGAFNGIYYVTQVQTSLLPPILTRALDYDQPSDMNNTGAIPVINGTVNANTSWILTSTVNTVGTDPLTYTQFSLAPSSLVTLTGTQTLTNKRISVRTVTVTQSATPSINTDNTDVASITGLAQAITSMTTNLTGTPVANDLLMIQITDNGTARAITWGSSFESTTNATLPTTTVISTMLRIGLQWNAAASKWDCIAVD